MERHVNMNGMVPSFCGPRNFYSNREWWTRAMWAFEAISSPSDLKFGYGAAMLTVLAQSGAASNEEKALLDTVWKTTGTQMWDSAIRRLLADSTLSASGDNSPPERPERIREGSGSLYREVLAARLKVVLDQELGRQTSSLVCELAGLQVNSVT
ncbi:hypothetical protein MUK71_07635 [Arthrobacter zhangbolii]|uniref:Uncharacterized protein n=1 Tax=Arthrobacter zhangbolii TaxID=2886936 RepID=A0A9X1M6E2_9MICC|nr:MULTISPECIES: hypothetical protein [Arthrobacter]MCC3271712.1 hypothetical protein [Arthrobacter zhangbolii]MCC3293615.1 hypothetical protein [Arthrobacter zhangbolii]MDN3904783.1 hypothetical protein [Arthrobacter sp. YD2]UON93460.1 hypothetical protein MUK71_07635 [Arthrobacter zhangbolii]